MILKTNRLSTSTPGLLITGHGKRGIRKSLDDNLISFINVIFLILIFFMIAGRIEEGMVFQVDPPISQSSGSRTEYTLIIAISEDGRIAVNNEIVDENSVVGVVTRLVSSSDITRVELRADENVSMEKFKKLLVKLNNSGIARLNLLATEN